MPKGMMEKDNYQEGGDIIAPMAPDEVGVEQGFAEDERAALSLAIEQFPAVGRVIEKLMEAAAPPAESPEDTVKANLAPGEFVFTADAVKEIGIGKLQSMMQKAEEGFIERQSGGKPVEGGEEMAYAKGGYVDEQGNRGFMQTMYEQGKETQENYMHKDSGYNYVNGGMVEEDRGYLGGKSFGDRLTEGVMGFFGKEKQVQEPMVEERESEIVKGAREMMERYPDDAYYKKEYEELKALGY